MAASWRPARSNAAASLRRSRAIVRNSARLIMGVRVSYTQATVWYSLHTRSNTTSVWVAITSQLKTVRTRW